MMPAALPQLSQAESFMVVVVSGCGVCSVAQTGLEVAWPLRLSARSGKSKLSLLRAKPDWSARAGPRGSCAPLPIL
jgi:hypothetical protein